MGLLVYKFSDYEHTAEREQFRTLCKSLKSFFGGKEDMCIFIANYNIYDCELDGIIIKNDAIISVEFKNYGGTVTAVENGHWKLSDGTIIKGGSRKTVYQQANLNHVAIKRGFADGNIIKPSCLKDVAALVVFNQDIILDNRLSSKAQSWLHITDNVHFLEKVEDITSKKTSLSNEEILGLIDKLGLDAEYRCDEYCVCNNIQETDIVDDEGKEVQKGTDVHHVQTDETAERINKSIVNILKEIFPNTDYTLNIYNKTLVEQLFLDQGIQLQKDYVATIFTNDLSYFQNRLIEFYGWDVTLHGSLLFWEIGKDEEKELKRIIKKQSCKHLSVQRVQMTLPDWLDDYIYNDLNGIYCKTNKDMLVIDWEKDEVLKYLGTYFPRSYTEAYCILSEYMKIANPFEEQEEISLFDFGCGTGGEIIGAITAIVEANPSLQHINIVALDGNYFALRTFEKILRKYCTKSSVHITYNVIPLVIDDFYDLSMLDNVLNQKFDIVMSFKSICEFVSKQRFEQDNAYAHIAKFFLPRINDNGVLLLADVTTYNNTSQEWLPHMMDEGLARAKCNVAAKNNGYNQSFYVTHSKMHDDMSKIAWRLILNNK